MAVTLVHGVPQVVADDDRVPQFKVPAVIDVTALRDALNAQLNGAEVTDEVTGVLTLTAAAYRMGMEYGLSLGCTFCGGDGNDGYGHPCGVCGGSGR
jgi:hypothetical protein